MPESPKPATSKFPTWDSMVADAYSSVDAIKTYEIPFSEDDVVKVPWPDGEQYVVILDGQRRGDAGQILNAMIKDDADRQHVVEKMRGVPFTIVDILTSKVIRHYYGLSLEIEAAKPGNPSGS